ncbi:MAG: hypothetical protein HY721_19040, partial [Planctomycetes bacterium]|nr:hypothetical protein [Planctomycetota bacterium]
MSSALAPAGRSRLGGRVLAPLAILAAAGAPYLGVLDAPFVFDDVKLVRDNALLREGWSDLWKVLETFDVTSRRWDEEDLRPNYRPLRFLSYLLDYQLTRACFGEPPPEGPRPTFFHLTNVLLHGLNALLVAAIARRLAGTLLAPPAPG